MTDFGLLGDEIAIKMPVDENGFTGRECPNTECEGHFKIVFGTGLDGENLPCHCPYCGHTAQHDQFWTQEQIEHIQSVALRAVSDAVRQELKGLEFDIKPRGPLGIGMSMKLKPGPRVPIHYYREDRLETDMVCAHCTLRYSVYGVFAFCPDCGQHNSLQILEMNLDVVGKMVDLAQDTARELSEQLIENALEDCVSAFDGFGRELCHVHASRSVNAERAQRIRFQDLRGARAKVMAQFRVDLAAPLTPENWRECLNLFQKRHVFAHKMGVVDKDYVDKTGDTGAIVGRKLSITSGDVGRLVDYVRAIARSLSGSL